MFREQNLAICCGDGHFRTSRALLRAGDAEDRDDPSKELITYPYSSLRNS
jgi:hypothetical protein